MPCSIFAWFIYFLPLITRLPADIYLLKVNNRNTRTRLEVCSKLTIKIPEGCDFITRCFVIVRGAKCLLVYHVLGFGRFWGKITLMNFEIFEVFNNALEQFIPNHSPKYVITITNSEAENFSLSYTILLRSTKYFLFCH